MARNPKLRLNFDSDVQYLLRMKYALEEDPAWPTEFKEEVVTMIVEITRMLSLAPKRKEIHKGIRK